MNIPNRGKYLSWHISDAWKGVLTGFIGALLIGSYDLFQKDTFPTWLQIGIVVKVAIGGALGNIIKNFFTNSQGKFLTKEPGDKQ